MTITHGPDGIIAVFFRDEGFYPVQFSGLKPARDEARDHAELNPGTRRIETTGGEVLWQVKGASQ
jgi:hypothetical protein